MTKIKEKIIYGVFSLNGTLVIIILIGIFLLLLLKAIPAFKEISILRFLFSADWNPTSYVKETYGILAMVVSTFMVTVWL